MATILEVQRLLLNDEQARRDFAADPRGFLAGQGLDIPTGLTLPGSLDPALVDAELARVGSAVEPDAAPRPDVDQKGPDFISAVVPALNQELEAPSVHDRLLAEPATGRIIEPAARSSVSVLVTVIAVVQVVMTVISPSVVGAAARNLHQPPPTGLRRVSRGAIGLTLEGPAGLSVRGLTIDDVADLIRRTRTA